MELSFSKIAKTTANAFGSHWAFLLALLLIVGWGLGGIFWYGFGNMSQLFINSTTTIITFLGVFLIQNAQNRSEKAIQLKLDELILSKSQANNCLINVESLSDKELEELHSYYLKISEEHRNRQQK